MKKYLFLMMTVLAIVGCSNNEELKDETYEVIHINKGDTSYDGKYMTISYFNQDILKYGLYKATEDLSLKEENKIWETKTDIIKETIDLGYGETMDAKFELHAVYFFPGETYNTYAMYIDTYCHAYYYFYDEKGNLLRKLRKTLPNIAVKLKLCPWDTSKAIIVERYGNSFEENSIVFEYDKNGNEKQITVKHDNSIQFEKEWSKIDGNHFFASVGQEILLFSLNNNTFTCEHSTDVGIHISEIYPDESHKPKFEIKNIEVKSDYSIAYVQVTLYNGESNNIEIKLNNETGEIMK